MNATRAPSSRPLVAGKIGVTFLCCYLLAVTFRIGGCYHPEPLARDETPERGPQLGQPFPSFELPDVSGVRIGNDDLAGQPAVLVFAPSLDWSAPTKASLIDLALALAGRRDLRVAVVMTEAQATARALAFVRDRDMPFYFLIDGKGFTERLGLLTEGPDKTPAAAPALFVLDAAGVVRLRDVRLDPRTWLSAEAIAGVLGPAPKAARLSAES